MNVPVENSSTFREDGSTPRPFQRSRINLPSLTLPVDYYFKSEENLSSSYALNIYALGPEKGYSVGCDHVKSLVMIMCGQYLWYSRGRDICCDYS